MTEVTQVDVLKRAVEVIQTGGWQREWFGDIGELNRPHCVMGAIRAAAYDICPAEDMIECTRLGERMMYSVGALLAEKVLDVNAEENCEWQAVAEWNDNVAEDEDDVVEFLRKGIEVASRD